MCVCVCVCVRCDVDLESLGHTLLRTLVGRIAPSTWPTSRKSLVVVIPSLTHSLTLSLTHCSATQYAGFTVTPIFGSVVSYLGFHYPVTTKMMYIDEFSVPALFMGILAAMLAVAFATFDRVTMAYTRRRVHFSVPRDSGSGDSISAVVPEDVHNSYQVCDVIGV